VHGVKQTVLIATYYRGNQRTIVNSKVNDVPAVLRCAMKINYSKTGITAMEISAHSLLAGGTMAMIFERIDLYSIQMMGRWNSDDMMRYLHIQAQPIINNYDARMYNHGTCAFLPDETVPITDNYGDD
jgi:hypothetical protein